MTQLFHHSRVFELGGPGKSKALAGSRDGSGVAHGCIAWSWHTIERRDTE